MCRGSTSRRSPSGPSSSGPYGAARPGARAPVPGRGAHRPFRLALRLRQRLPAAARPLVERSHSCRARPSIRRPRRSFPRDSSSDTSVLGRCRAVRASATRRSASEMLRKQQLLRKRNDWMRPARSPATCRGRRAAGPAVPAGRNHLPPFGRLPTRSSSRGRAARCRAARRAGGEPSGRREAPGAAGAVWAAPPHGCSGFPRPTAPDLPDVNAEAEDPGARGNSPRGGTPWRPRACSARASRSPCRIETRSGRGRPDPRRARTVG